jgi:DNA-binding LacI/PurR family transcriptional regulator
MKTTLKDIAEATGYSISTVSRVLSGSGKIGSKAQKEILICAEKLNYPISKINRPFSIDTNKRFALVVTGHHIGEFYASFFHGFNLAAIENDVQLFLLSLHKPKKELKNILLDLTKNYHAIILFAPELTQEEYKELNKSIPPLYPIISNGLIENPVFSTITFDSYSGGHLAAAHFERNNYDTVGIIKGPFQKAEARFRYNGFRDYVLQSESMDFVWECDGDFTFEAGVKAFECFERAKQKPRAIFTCNDLMAHAFLEKAKACGYKFPEDIAIIGFDDLPANEQRHPTVSSIRTDFKNLGETSISELIERIKKPTPQHGMLSMVPVSLQVRESS